MKIFIWIWIFFTLNGEAHTTDVTACYGISGDPCYSFNLTCDKNKIIRITAAEYGYKHSSSTSSGCCDLKENDCFANYSHLHAAALYESCSGRTMCSNIRAQTPSDFECKDFTGSKYAHVKYDCIMGASATTKKIGTSVNTSSTILTSTASLTTSEVISSDKHSSTSLTSASFNRTDIDGEEHPEHLIISLVVVVAVLVLSAISVIVFLLHRRRCKKSSEEDGSKNQLPDGLIIHSNSNFGVSSQNYKAAENSNYDEINDESIATYAWPVKKKKDHKTIAKDEKKNGENCATDEYDRIEFEENNAVKMPDYDSASTGEVKKLDNTYSHVSNQSKKPASEQTANEYSHCQFRRNESGSNDYTNKTAVSNEPHVADNYYHVDCDAEKMKRMPVNIIEEDSYNHIELDKSTNPSRNGHAVSVQTIHKSEESSQAIKGIESLDVESEGWPASDRNSGVSSLDPPLQDIKAVSLPDDYIEFKTGDIYDTPRCKDKQYNVVLKGNKEKLFNTINTGSKQKSGTEDNNGVTEDCAVGSDYELAKPIDF